VELLATSTLRDVTGFAMRNVPGYGRSRAVTLRAVVQLGRNVVAPGKSEQQESARDDDAGGGLGSTLLVGVLILLFLVALGGLLYLTLLS
jgi:hypothetical protein